MKQILIFWVASVLYITGYAQQKKTSSTKCPLIQVLNWSEMSMLIAPEIFNGKEEEILKQMSKEEFERVKKYNTLWPSQMQYDLKFVKDTIALKAFNNKLGKLKLYKAAMFKHIFQGTDWGKYVILRVPYEENVNWDTAAKWDGDIYFIVPEKAIIEIH